MKSLLLLALLGLIGCAPVAEQAPTVPVTPEPDEAPLSDLLSDLDTLIVDPLEAEQTPADLENIIQALTPVEIKVDLPALETSPLPEPPKDFWDRLRNDFELARLPEGYAVDKQWRSLQKNNPALLSDFLARGQLWLNYIAGEIDRRGIPAELTLLPYVESGFRLTARSHRGAAGPWQIMPGTAQFLGLSRTRTCDQRLDVLASTDAALNYLEYLASEFNGDWFLAIAAYNSGPGRVANAIKANKKAGKPTDFWSLRLPRETRQYVPRLLALAEIVRNPKKFDITLPAVPMVPVFDQLSLEAAVDLQLLADWSNTSVDDLRTLNPCLRRFHTPVDGSVVAVPVGSSERILAELAEIPRSEWAQMREYTVKSGDTLGGIALRFDMTVAELKKLNKLKSNLIRINQVLAVTSGNAQDIPEGGNLHRVQAGESLSVIAQRYGVSVRSLRAVNDLGRYLQIGEQLVIPGR